MIFVYCLSASVITMLIMLFVTSSVRIKLTNDRDEYYASWQQEQALRIAANVLVSKLASESELHKENAQRYDLVRYYMENDHGTIAVEAFYGPQAIRSAAELDLILDEELDRRWVAEL
jgi:hypothetical protein